ncbi:MAG: hypothetical protein H0W04_07555 [Chthoniobacterales bacterium]|nr:hypothetical protein [Chthoniobacterales bacterium]
MVRLRFATATRLNVDNLHDADFGIDAMASFSTTLFKPGFLDEVAEIIE